MEKILAHFIDQILDPPSYGYERNGALHVPSIGEILKEFISRLNIFRSRKAWLPLFCWSLPLLLEIPAMLFLFKYFTWKGCLVGLIYCLVILPAHGTVWLHRYGTHRAFTFRNKFWRFLCRNLVIKYFPEEVYVISHHVHHSKPDEPGDPYNPQAGWLYCFLSDVNHQSIARDLTPEQYARVAKLVEHTGVHLNSYEQYQRWGSICHPLRTLMHFSLNWIFWWGVFFLVGGLPMAIAVFGLSTVWGWGIRGWNYNGHGGGKDKRRDGIDFHRKDLSINDTWTGWVAGEWHNNHHLYPSSARVGFLKNQPDIAWAFIHTMHRLGGVTSYNDATSDFLKKYASPAKPEEILVI